MYVLFLKKSIEKRIFASQILANEKNRIPVIPFVFHAPDVAGPP
jgi:hypothetical protein